MNIFYLNRDPKLCAQEHCDKHVVKMIIEYAQLMSTAHRMLDGKEWSDKTANGRKIKRWKLDGDLEQVLYKASHINHPDNVWVRKSNNNYNWLYYLFCSLCDEYTYRYGKVHATDSKLREVLKTPPKNIEVAYKTELPQCMPDACKAEDTVSAYRNYYINEKANFAKWTKRKTPRWFINANI